MMRWRNSASASLEQQQQQEDQNSSDEALARVHAHAHAAVTTTSAEENVAPSVPVDETATSSLDTPQYSQQQQQQSSATSAATTSSTTDAAASSTTATTELHNNNHSDNINDDDDDGGDHAENDDDENNLQHIHWKPQNVSSTCEFTHTILDYAQKRESGCKKAEYSTTTVDEFGNRWRLIVYVNGNGRASNHHLSLFLQVADADDLPFGWKKAVSYVLTLEHPTQSQKSYAKRNPDKTFKLCPKAIDWGWSQFITSDRIQQEGYVHQDALLVRAQVTVKSSSVRIDEEDSELYLKCAVEEGDVEAVKVCLEHGASVNCQFKDDLYTPLHTACSSNVNDSMQVLHLLLQEGADGNACNKWKETPLLIAANNGHRAAVEALLQHGANPSLCSEAGWSALTFAAHKGYDEIVALLLHAGAPVNCPVTEDASTPLHKACAGSKPGHLAAVQLLLEGGADVHALNKWRETPLLTAANHGQDGAVDALLAAGADPCKCTDTGWSPLSIAAYKGHDEVVRLLLEEGAPTEEDDPTLSALLQAATKGLPDTVELLLRHGADHTVTTKKGDTALSILVEQNLIDAAVEMVTEYNANIPRCSRDRKKVQRARLLINLRMKQMEREGNNQKDPSGGSTDEEESDEEEAGPRRAQHEQEPQQQQGGSSPGKKRKKKKNRLSAEEKARAAEEALLLELEQEESKAEKEKANANSKRRKKKERKAKEREQKMKEEQAQREREERERDRIRKEKEERERKKRQMQLREQQEREKKEMMEREKVLAAKREEQRKRNNKLKADQAAAKRDAEKTDVSSASNESRGRNSAKVAAAAAVGKSNGAVAQPKASAPSNRRWETTAKNKSPSRAVALQAYNNPPTPSKRSVEPASTTTLPQNTLERTPRSTTAPKPVLTPRAVASAWNSAEASFPASPVPPPAPPATPASVVEPVATPPREMLSQLLTVGAEHPAIALFRREKVVELMSRCTQALAISEDTLLKRIFYRWSTRAAHDPAPYLDPLIPSWTESERVVTFLQRQLIAESRRTGGLPPSMEALKEAGSLIAMYCQNLATEVDQFRRRIEEHLPKDWSDSALGMTVSDGTLGGNGAVVTLSWADRAQVFIASGAFATLRERHIGPPSRFLAACFMAKMWYDTRRLVFGGTTLDFRLSPRTKRCLSAVANVSAELWSEPFAIESGNVFWGTLESVDSLFGGQKPFSKDQLGGEEVLAKHGGSLSVFLPMDANVASSYVHRMTDLLKKTQDTNVPVSFVVFAHVDCFHDLPNDPAPGDLRHLDPRLMNECQSFVRCTEVLLASRHTFHHGDGQGAEKICGTASLLTILQNEAGKNHFDVTPSSIATIIGSLSLPTQVENSIVPPIGLTNDFRANDMPLAPHGSYFDGLPPISPDPQRVVRTEVGTIGGATIPHPFSPASETPSRGTRNRGRLFDLVDNGEDDDVDLVSGMLNNLDVGLFQNNNVGSDVDIEAISLMGIGGPPHSVPPGRSHQGGFS